MPARVLGGGSALKKFGIKPTGCRFDLLIACTSRPRPNGPRIPGPQCPRVPWLCLPLRRRHAPKHPGGSTSHGNPSIYAPTPPGCHFELGACRARKSPATDRPQRSIFHPFL